MKNLYLILLAISPFGAAAQVVQSAGAANIPVNWRPAFASDSVQVDVTGDGRPDLSFTASVNPSGGQGQPSVSRFTVLVKSGSNLEVAINANEFDSAHRFLAGDRIGAGLIWRNRGGGYLDYTIQGNGGTGGRGFFRNNADGFVVFRQVTASQTRYWWFYVEPRLAAGSNWIGYYAGTAVALAAATAVAPALVDAFPNPATTAWSLSVPAAYSLFDSQGKLIRSSATPITSIDARTLPSGLYTVFMRTAKGTTRCNLLKQ